MNNYYNPTDQPRESERQQMWTEINKSIRPLKQTAILHWRSFWLGNAAAILIVFATTGIYSTTQLILNSNESRDENTQMYEALNSATHQLKNLPPILINQATEQQKPGLESTTRAIEEIDLLIDEIKQDMLINGETPAKRDNLKRLYATKLDFYKDLLLKEENQS